MESTASLPDVRVSSWTGVSHYVKWWVFWMATLSMSSGIGRLPRGDAALNFGQIAFGAIFYLGVGGCFGLLAGVVFTFLQNSMNRRRRKVVSWLLGISTYLVLSTPIAIWIASRP